MKKDSPQKTTVGKRSAVKRPRTTPKDTSAAILFDEQYRILFDTMSQGVIFRDAEGRIISANSAAERILGRALKDLLGKTSAEVHTEALREDGTRLPAGAFPADVALRTGQPSTGFVMATLNPRENKYRWVSVNAMPIFRPGENRPFLVYILFDDITERRRIDQELRNAHDHLELEVQERTRELAGTNEELSAQIAVRKKVEVALRESEEKFRRLAENAVDLIYVYRLFPERKFEYVSPSATDITGYSPLEHYANPDLGFQLIHADDRGKLADIAAGKMDPLRPLVLRWIRKDGRVIWTEQRNIPIMDESGRIVALQGIARDITDRVKIEEKLRESEKFLQTVIDTEPECVKMLAKDGALLMMNRAGLDMIQAESFGQVQGTSVYGLVVPDYRRQFAALTESAFAGKSGTLAFEAVGLKGRPIWLETHAVPLRDDKDTIIAALGITRDITERKRAEEALRRSEALYHDLVETSQDLIWQCDAEGRYVYLNPAWEEVFGYKVDEMLGKRFTDFQTPDRAKRDMRGFARIMKGKQAQGYETVHIGKDGRDIHLLFNAKSVRDAAGNITGTRGTAYDITERKRIEDAVREREFWIRESQRVAHLGSYILDIPTGRWTSSEILDDIFGIEKGYERSINGWGDLIHPEDRERMMRYFADIVDQQTRFEADYRIIRKNSGEVRWVSGLGELILDGKGAPVKMLGTIQDVTDRKRVEHSLLTSEQRYKQLLESVTSYIYTVTVENGSAVSTVHGPGCVAVTGYTSAEYAADPFLWYRMVHDRDKHLALKQAEDLLAGMHPGPIEHRIRHKNGSLVWVRSTVVPRTDEQGRLEAYDGLISDIAAQKRAEEFSRNILETVDEGFLVIDRNYTIVSVNKAYSRQSGREPQDIVGRKCHEVSHKLSRPCYEQGEECAVRRAFETESPHTVMHTHHDPAGNNLYVETKAFPLRDEDGRVVAAIEIINNITDKKKLEDQLRHAQKMEVIGLLAGGISHDFNNILTAIIGYGNLLKMKIPVTDPLHSYVEQILASSARAANLTQSLLAFSRKQIINPRPMDINDPIRRFEKLLHRVIGEDVDLRTELASGTMTIFADSSQLEQVLMNLATNARDAMPQGGILTIGTETAEISEEFRRRHGFGIPGRYACMSVRDTGTGMDKTTLGRIFEPFYTTKEPGRGTGLGLAIVYGIMKQNNGYVIVESEPGVGTCFSLYFPLIATSAGAAKTAEPVLSDEGHETILVAEDDVTIRQLTKTILGEFGYAVIEAVDGEDAVQKFLENKEGIQLVILDVVMPKKNGKETRDLIAALKPDVKVLYISGYNAEVLLNKGIDADTANFILKPVSPMDLLRSVRRIIDSDSGLPKATSR
ncbi:MAG: PAS domain S-box protein [Nitrospirae bacterium]|nr:PAS domain S-box protein [Nitrospirota bacterium]NTW64818.1 PAS domain S-box protein [Nitrospirota bacterium]